MGAPKDPYMPKRQGEFESFTKALERGTHRPFLGVTQGGSSRKNSGAKVAATTTDRSNNGPNTGVNNGQI
jgi:hypothetical protein